MLSSELRGPGLIPARGWNSNMPGPLAYRRPCHFSLNPASPPHRVSKPRRRATHHQHTALARAVNKTLVTYPFCAGLGAGWPGGGSGFGLFGHCGFVPMITPYGWCGIAPASCGRLRALSGSALLLRCGIASEPFWADRIVTATPAAVSSRLMNASRPIIRRCCALMPDMKSSRPGCPFPLIAVLCCFTADFTIPHCSSKLPSISSSATVPRPSLKTSPAPEGLAITAQRGS